MANGVFSLLEVRTEQVKNIANEDFASWPEGGAYGYFAGNNNVDGGSVINRLDFFNDTFGSPGNMPTTNRLAAIAVTNARYGYIAGGNTSPTIINTINRIDFSSETLSLPGNNLPTARQYLAAVSNNSYGYFGGGNTPTIINTISRLDLSTETIGAAPTNLPTTISSLAGTSSESYGYFGGGETPTIINTINRLDFSSETISIPGKNLPDTRRFLSAVGNKTFGYFAGGNNGPGATISNVIDRIDFSSETISSPGRNLPTTRDEMGVASSNLYGYFAQGNTTPGTSDVSTLTKLDFSTETATNSTSCPSAGQATTGFSGGQSILRGKGVKTYGYFCGDFDGSQYTRLDFSTEVLSDPGASFSTPNGSKLGNSTAVSNNYLGYLCGSDQNFVSNIWRLDFVNDSIALTNSLIPTVVGDPGQLANSGGASSNGYGYLAGGQGSTTTTSLILRLDFYSETIQRSPTNLPAATGITATQNNSYGYFSGGAVTKTGTSSVNRLDFSNETIKSIQNSPTTTGNAVGVSNNNNFGYFMGGGQIVDIEKDGINTIVRLDFSTETHSLPGKNLPSLITTAAGTESSSYGYFGGGVGPGQLTTLYRLDFSNENLSLAPSTFSSPRFKFTALSNSN